MVYRVEGSRGRRRHSGVMYKIECSDCDHVYFGETSRNAYTRACEHTKLLDKKKDDSVLNIHNMDNKEQHRHPTVQYESGQQTPHIA